MSRLYHRDEYAWNRWSWDADVRNDFDIQVSWGWFNAIWSLLKRDGVAQAISRRSSLQKSHSRPGLFPSVSFAADLSALFDKVSAINDGVAISVCDAAVRSFIEAIPRGATVAFQFFKDLFHTITDSFLRHSPITWQLRNIYFLLCTAWNH